MQGAPAFWTVPAQSRSKCLLLSWMKPRMRWCGSPARLTQGQIFQLNAAKAWIKSELFNYSKTKIWWLAFYFQVIRVIEATLNVVGGFNFSSILIVALGKRWN